MVEIFQKEVDRLWESGRLRERMLSLKELDHGNDNLITVLPAVLEKLTNSVVKAGDFAVDSIPHGRKRFDGWSPKAKLSRKLQQIVRRWDLGWRWESLRALACKMTASTGDRNILVEGQIPDIGSSFSDIEKWINKIKEEVASLNRAI